MIIYISDSLDSKKNGGVSTSGYEFLQFLRIKYKEVTVITNDFLEVDNKKEFFYDFPLNPITKVITLKRTYPIKPFSLKKLAKKLFYFFRESNKNTSCHLKEFFDINTNENILFVNSWSGLYNRNRIKGADGFVKVCIVRGSPESFIWQSFEKDKNIAVEKAATFLEQFDKLIFVSNNGLKAWNKIFKQNIDSFYLPNSINEKEVEKIKKISLENAKSKLGLNSYDYNIIVVGSVQKRKAQDLLLDVVEDLIKVIPNLKFHIIGGISSTWGGKKIYTEIINSEYSNYFIFHGHSDNQLLFMQAAELLLFTSRAEAFPRTVAEYMAIGKPIVAADVSGVNEMIIHNQNGLLYNPNNSNELLDSIIRVYREPDLRSQTAKNATLTYFSKFSKKKHIQTSLSIFERIEKSKL